ncbi:hypothetical protein [Xanthomonas vesicatoria]|uniref:hypothetical protein n=1 Tax=Xanthomonas vesicatoria TaxID=56460 RepID=UPI001E41DD28|nr:hypothetical protein [Xanthomonas vesicatoria]MCC8616943.1 hypothetical protein [Xanthomonas vesicatoria]MCC8630782.1 hypothetical protein [Xanthomonas vesicatoria]
MTARPRRPRHPISRFATGLLLSIGLCAGSANAQVVVTNPTGMAKDLKEYAEQAKRWTETIKQYQQQLQHYQQQLIKLQRLQFNEPELENKFVTRDLSHGLDAYCPGASGIAGLFERMVPVSLDSLTGNDLQKTQNEICKQIVVAQNSQYNEAILMIQRLVERSRDFERVQRQRDNGGDKQGSLAANDNEVQRYAARNAMELSHWEARMKAYDIYIAGLKDDQSLLAKRALEGDKNDILGQVIQAGALKIALSR